MLSVALSFLLTISLANGWTVQHGVVTRIFSITSISDRRWPTVSHSSIHYNGLRPSSPLLYYRHEINHHFDVDCANNDSDKHVANPRVHLQDVENQRSNALQRMHKSTCNQTGKKNNTNNSTEPTFTDDDVYELLNLLEKRKLDTAQVNNTSRMTEEMFKNASKNVTRALFIEETVNDYKAKKDNNINNKKNNKKENTALLQLKKNVADFWNQPIVEVLVCMSVLISSGLVAVSTLPSLSMHTQEIILWTGEIIGAFLALEVLARWFCSPASKMPGGQLLNPQFAIDVLVVILPLVFSVVPNTFWEASLLPNWLTSPGTLVNLKLLRVLRLRRVLEDKETFLSFERALGVNNENRVEDWQLQLARVLLSLFTLLSVSAGMIYAAERDVNPMIGNYFNALYFSLTTLTTVGFGDITPVTTAGRFVVCASIIAGVAVVPAQAAALVDALYKRQDLLKQEQQEQELEEAVEEQIQTSTESQVVQHTATSLSTENTVVGQIDEFKTNKSSQMVLDIALQCESCGATLHWGNAKFCYYCGNKLHKQND